MKISTKNKRIVRSEDELRGLLAQGWKLYQHAGVHRWYIHKGRKDWRIVAPRLDRVCEAIYEKKGIFPWTENPALVDAMAEAMETRRFS